MTIKKSELYSSLWKSCDELRGGIDASQYKDYVLVLLFVKYVSDKYAGQKNALLDVPAEGSFADMVALKGDKEIGEKINTIIARLAEANDLKGVIDVADFNDPDKLASSLKAGTKKRGPDSKRTVRARERSRCTIQRGSPERGRYPLLMAPAQDH
jgi:type I restriction-modification system DNA methylase subunit